MILFLRYLNKLYTWIYSKYYYSRYTISKRWKNVETKTYLIEILNVTYENDTIIFNISNLENKVHDTQLYLPDTEEKFQHISITVDNFWYGCAAGAATGVWVGSGMPFVGNAMTTIGGCVVGIDAQALYFKKK